jgi:hypothetical protein
MKHLLQGPLFFVFFLSFLLFILSWKNTTLVLWFFVVIFIVVERLHNGSLIYRQSKNTICYDDIVIQKPKVPSFFCKVLTFCAVISFFLPFDFCIRNENSFSIRLLPVYYYQHSIEFSEKRLESRGKGKMNIDYVCFRSGNLMENVKYAIVIIIPVCGCPVHIQ